MTLSAYKKEATAAAILPIDTSIDPRAVARQISKATKLLKDLANQHRLLILCHLVDGERSVGALEQELGIAQAHLSQQLARLREAGLVQARRDSRMIYYSIASAEAASVLALLYRLYCPAPVAAANGAAPRRSRKHA
jgi:ArsR family transcriptional regulator